MHIGTIIGFSSVTFLAVATPGPDVILAMSNGSRFGLRRAVPGFLAVLCSDLIMIGAVAGGLGAILIDSAILFSTIKYLGAAYLLYLGLKMILAAEAKLEFRLSQSGSDARGKDGIAWRSFVVAVTNPKAYVFFAALLPQFVDASLPLAPQYAMLTIAFACVELTVMLAYAGMGSRLGSFLLGPRKVWIERFCGVGLLAAGASLLLANRVATKA